MPIILLICFARSGGTILNKCLGSLPGVVILSEINPLGGGTGKGNISYKTIKSQARNWYGIDLKSQEDDFVSCAVELEKLCKERKNKLMIRDWSYINFVPSELNQFKPEEKLLSFEVLKKECELIPFAFVRDAIDVWISLKRIFKYTHADFFKWYLVYVRTIINLKIPIFKYENFVDNPDNILQEICEICGLQYSTSYKNYKKFDKLNGDIQFGKSSRGMRQNKIIHLSRRIIPKEEIKLINKCRDMAEANILLGYPTSYDIRKIERFHERFFDNLYFRAYQLSKRIKKGYKFIKGNFF